MKSLLLAALWMIPFYFLGLFGCLWLLPYLSPNSHDASIEAAMTGAFFVGPLAALAGFTGGFFFHRSRKSR